MLWVLGSLLRRLSPHLWLSQVTVDGQGLMRITHMGIAGQGPMLQGGGDATQRAARSWVEFMILPDDASIEDEE